MNPKTLIVGRELRACGDHVDLGYIFTRDPCFCQMLWLCTSLKIHQIFIPISTVFGSTSPMATTVVQHLAPSEGPPYFGSTQNQPTQSITSPLALKRDVLAELHYHKENEDGSPPHPTYVDKPETYNRPFETHQVKIRDVSGDEEKYTLDQHGFQIHRHQSAEKHFLDDAQIKSGYYEEVEQLLKSVYGFPLVIAASGSLERDWLTAYIALEQIASSSLITPFADSRPVPQPRIGSPAAPFRGFTSISRTRPRSPVCPTICRRMPKSCSRAGCRSSTSGDPSKRYSETHLPSPRPAPCQTRIWL